MWCNSSTTVFSWLAIIKLEPSNGNIISGDDDNGESLTDNADGNSVGIDS